MTAQACSSEMGAEKEWRIWSRLRQSAGSSRAPRQPVSRSMSRGHAVSRVVTVLSLLAANHESSLACESLPGRVHDAVTYSIMLVTSDDAVALLVSQISPGLEG